MALSERVPQHPGPADALAAVRGALGRLLVAPSRVEISSENKVFPTEPSLSGLDDVLPDGGFSPGSVVELSALRAAGGATTFALAALVSAQRDPLATVAIVDPERSLHAPALVAHGIDLARCLVIVPPREKLARIAAKVVESGAFTAVLVDVHSMEPRDRHTRLARTERAVQPQKMAARNATLSGAASERLVRRLAVSAAATGTLVLLRSDRLVAKSVPWPTALRLEITPVYGAGNERSFHVHVAKDRYGRIGAKAIVRKS